MERLEWRVKQGGGWKRGVKKEIWGGTANAEGHLRGHMENCY